MSIKNTVITLGNIIQQLTQKISKFQSSRSFKVMPKLHLNTDR